MNIKLSGITFITTYNCNANCEHCFFDTKGKPDYMNPEIIDMVYADPTITKNMFWNHFSGGESLINQPVFLEILKKTKSYFSGNIGISTNAFWAHTPQIASRVVQELVRNGVTGIAVSADYYHEKFIPIEYPKHVVQAIEQAGIKTHCYIMGARCNDDVWNAEYINAQSIEIAQTVQNGSHMPLAPTQIRSLGKGSNCNIPKKNEIPMGKCTNLSECLGHKSPKNPAMVWVDVYGNVMVCYGIIIGNVYETPFAEIIASYSFEKFPIMHSLSEEGPVFLYELAKQKGLMHETKFYDECDVCFQSRKSLQKAYPMFGPAECYP